MGWLHTLTITGAFRIGAIIDCMATIDWWYWWRETPVSTVSAPIGAKSGNDSTESGRKYSAKVSNLNLVKGQVQVRNVCINQQGFDAYTSGGIVNEAKLLCAWPRDRWQLSSRVPATTTTGWSKLHYYRYYLRYHKWVGVFTSPMHGQSSMVRRLKLTGWNAQSRNRHTQDTRWHWN